MDSMTMQDRIANAIVRRLDLVISLLLEQGSSPSKTVTDKIVRLIEFGLSDAETAAVIGKKPSYVTAVKARIKKAQGEESIG